MAGATLDEAPTRFGRYRVVRRLGRGGMGAVYEVRDASGAELALKTLTREGAELSFRREFHTMARLAHPRIVAVRDFGIEGGRPYYTMELLGGTDLKDLAPAPWRTACSLVRDVASALALLHTQGLVHRDIAPRNVRSMPDGRAKIIDFGLVASAGSVPAHLAGTPPYVAPEALRGAPIDHRLDLFSLGALAHWLLTGENAFGARRFADLVEAWLRPVPKLGTRVADLDPRLEELVHGLLSLDPLARPSSAAEVIERLTAIADLAPLPEAEARRGYLASAALVGRKREVRRMRRHVQRAVAGHGHAFVIAAVSGTGKTRLLRELAFEAQLAGAIVLRADASRGERGAYGVVRELARALLDALPEPAAAAAESRLPALARIIPELRSRLGRRALHRLGDPAEDRMLLQESLRDWFVDAAAKVPLVLAVDDAQRADEASAGCLAAIAHAAASSRILVAATVRTDETPIAASRLAALEDAGATLRLRGLEPSDVEALVRALFGDVPNAVRLARWMQRVAGGSPLLCTELARHLVETNAVRWVDGVWMIPAEVERAVPAELAEAMDARIAALPEAALRFVRALAVVPGDLSLELAVELGGASDPTAVFDLIAELMRQEILTGAGDRFRFRHDCVREAAIRSIEGERDVFRRVARALRARGEASDGDLGLLHLRGDEPELAAPLLRAAAQRAYDAQGFYDAIALLEAALDANERTNGSAAARLELLTMLVMSGSFHDRDVALRYAGPTLDALRRYAGVELASRLYEKIGRVAALGVGQLVAWSRWLFSSRRRRGPTPHAALREFFTTAGITVALHATSYHRDKVEALVESLEPVAILPTKAPHALYLFSRALLALIRGRLPEVHELTDRILWILENDRTTPLPDVQRRTALAGARHLRAIAAVSRLEPSLDHELDEISKIGIRYFDLAAIHVRILKHHYRGETQVVAALEAQAEPLALAIGSTWQLDGLIPIAAGYGHALMRDVVGLRRCVEDLERMIGHGYGVAPFLHMVRGEYLRERGQLDEAIASFEAGRGETPVLDQVVLSGLAETLLAKGDLERARACAAECLELARAADYGSVFVRVRTHRTLASIHVIEGDFDAAKREAEAGLDEARSTDVPLLRGIAHETRARIAILSGDRAAFEAHRVECDRIFRKTENPLLIARAERLPELAAEARASRGARAESEGTLTDRTLLDRAARSEVVTLDLVASGVRLATGRTGLLSACRGPVERASLALEIAVEATRASRGFLFLVDGPNLELAAPRFGAEPPHGVVAELERSLAEQGEEVTAAAFEEWRRVVLRNARGVAVGALALLDAVAAGPGDAHLFSLLADELAPANELERSVPPSQGP